MGIPVPDSFTMPMQSAASNQTPYKPKTQQNRPDGNPCLSLQRAALNLCGLKLTAFLACLTCQAVRHPFYNPAVIAAGCHQVARLHQGGWAL